MIEVKELTKIYKSRKGGTCVALDRISFTLPDKGFIFVIGKSGSGKTTLLSLLGGLDTVTSGEIVENGNRVDTFKLTEQVYYRNSTIGFIFQDFHLIDDLTVFENIMLALQLQGEKDRDKVLKALADTDLADFGNRYPKELSGGQKQRVAIARALVKQPSVILADEPTGNLDSKTTAQILALLKELSKDKLVVIVSHTLSDAQKYADEIIELSDGKIIQHVKRNEAFDTRLRVENDTLVIPDGEKFGEEDLEAVAKALKRGVGGIRQDTDRFLPYEDRESEGGMSEQGPLEKKHLRFKDTAKLAMKFARRSRLRTCVYAVIFAAVLVVLGLSQLIMNFNGGEVVSAEMDKRALACTSFIKDTNMIYDSVDTSRLVDVEKGDLQKFYDAGYEGEVYPLVNYALFNLGSNVCVSQQRLLPQTNPYDVKETVGVLVTEVSFLENRFGPLEYVALCDEPKDYGIYITDFFADACMASHPGFQTGYESFLGKSNQYTGYCYGYINGIIKTGYRERFKEILAKLTDPNVSKEELKKLTQTDACLAFHDDITQFLNVAYSFEPDFAQIAADSKIRQFVSAGISTFEKDGREYEYKESWFSSAELQSDVPLHDNEILMNYDVYNEIFGTSYTPQNMNEFRPHEVHLKYYLLCDQNKSQEKYEATLRIVGLNNNKARINIADNIMRDLQRAEMFTFGYYFEDDGQTELLFNAASDNGFIPNSAIGGSITAMTKAVGVFSRFFDLIFVVLCAALLLLMVQFELKNIRDKMRDIGIMKALGARDIDLVIIFGFQVLIVALAMIALYIAGSFVFIGLANKVLVLSLSELAKNTVVLDVAFLAVKWKYILQNCVLALGIIVVSFLVPMLRLRYIKPTNVIKAKE